MTNLIYIATFIQAKRHHVPTDSSVVSVIDGQFDHIVTISKNQEDFKPRQFGVQLSTSEMTILNFASIHEDDEN